ncbi:hypothetical protein CR513_27075, partial [Mucuna pruriens]
MQQQLRGELASIALSQPHTMMQPIVATRKVYKLGLTMHHQTLHEDHVRVVELRVWARKGASLSGLTSLGQATMLGWGVSVIRPTHLSEPGHCGRPVSLSTLFVNSICQLYLSRGSEHLYGFIDPLPLQTIDKQIHKILDKLKDNIFNDNVAPFLDEEINDIRQRWT